MSYLQWNNKLKLNINSMDQEHQELIKLMNGLHDLVNQLKPKAEIEKALFALLNYAKKHFNDEEKYMETIGFDGFENHKILHRRLIERLEGFARDFSSGKSPLKEDFFNFLKFWLESHIMGIDIKYANFSHKKKQG